MKILLLTDIHYGEDTHYPTYKNGESAQNFGKNFAQYKDSLQKIAQECNLVVNLGDLMQQTKSFAMDEARYQEAVAALDFGVPILHVVGNHDLVNLDRKTVAKIIREPGIYYSKNVSGYHCIVLDGNRDGKTRPEPFRFDQDQIDWLKSDLESTNLPTLVFSHYPIAKYSLEENPIFKVLGPSMAFPIGSKIVQGLLEQSKKVLAVFSGHMHFNHEQIENNILHFVVGSFTRNNDADGPTAEYALATIENKVVIVTKEQIPDQNTF